MTIYLRYEELLRVARGGSFARHRPLQGHGRRTARPPRLHRILSARSRQLRGVRQVTLTTNGLLLPPLLDELCASRGSTASTSAWTPSTTRSTSASTRRTHTADDVLAAVRLCAARLPTTRQRRAAVRKQPTSSSRSRELAQAAPGGRAFYRADADWNGPKPAKRPASAIALLTACAYSLAPR